MNEVQNFANEVDRSCNGGGDVVKDELPKRALGSVQVVLVEWWREVDSRESVEGASVDSGTEFNWVGVVHFEYLRADVEDAVRCGSDKHVAQIEVRKFVQHVYTRLFLKHQDFTFGTSLRERVRARGRILQGQKRWAKPRKNWTLPPLSQIDRCRSKMPG